MRIFRRILRMAVVIGGLIGTTHADLHAQRTAAEMKFGHLGLEHGLSHASVFTILHDQEGVLWFGTEDGLNKYDGYAFTAYQHDDADPHSIGNSWVRSLLQSRDGAIWVGTDYGVSRFDRDTGQFTNYPIWLKSNPSQHDAVLSSCEDREGRLWFGTAWGAIYRFDPVAQNVTFFRDAPNLPDNPDYNSVLTIYEDHLGAFWIVTRHGGVSLFDRAADEFTSYRPNPDDPQSLSGKEVSAFYEDRAGTLWVGTLIGGGLNRFDRDAKTFRRYLPDPANPESLAGDGVMAIVEDVDGRLWLGSAESGVSVFDPQTETFVNYRHNADDPTGYHGERTNEMYRDRAGTLWMATQNLGINMHDATLNQFPHYRHRPDEPNSVSFNVIRSIHSGPDGVLWIGTEGGGLNRFDLAAQTFASYRSDPQNPASLSQDVISAVHVDHSGAVWAGTWKGGLNKLDPATGAVTRFQPNPKDPENLRLISMDRVQAILEDRHGMLWLGGRGVNKFDPATGLFTRYLDDPKNPDDLKGNSVQTNAFLEGRDGALWIGTWQGGVNRFDPQTETFTHFEHDPQNLATISDNRVIALCEDRNGLLWVGTPGSGVNKLDPKTGQVTRYSMKDGLPNNVVYGILEDARGLLWMSTNKGLAVFDPAASSVINVYTASDGLQGDQFFWGAAHKMADGRLVFGGLNGFNIIDPAAIRTNPTPPPVVLTSLTQGGQPIISDRQPDRLQRIELDWRQNFFEFSMAALNYLRPEKNRYAYMLEGVDKEWYYSGSIRHGRYVNLPDGVYTLRLKGSNNDGVWNEQGAALTVTIHPPFWRTWWFDALAASVLALAVLSVSLEVRRRRRVHAQLQQAKHDAELLGKEMELARQIQTAILPKQFAHDELAIEAIMLPAEEVGGDYYDIVYGKNGALWLAIGDVAGHGMTPGLIMMMAQTVHTTITTQMDASPKNVVVATNEILYKNVHERLQAEHHMTFTTLKYLGGGVFRHAGSHLDLIIHRRATQTCELIDTPGVFLNFVEDISDMTDELSFTLDLGDTLVLYTDGLTEAANADGKILPMERFLEMIRAHADQPPAAMRDAIMQDVLAWSGGVREDDMTLMVARRVR